MRWGYGQVSTMPAPPTGGGVTARPFWPGSPGFQSDPPSGGGGGGAAAPTSPQDPYGPGGQVTPPEGATPPLDDSGDPIQPGPGPTQPPPAQPGPMEPAPQPGPVPPNGTMPAQPPPGMATVLRDNATKVVIAGGAVLLTGVVIGYFIGKGTRP